MLLKKLLILLLVLCSYGLQAQTNFRQIEIALGKQRNEQKISDNEYYSRLKSEAGVLSELNLWIESEDTIVVKSGTKKLSLRFPEKFQIVMPNGNKYAQAYLQNNTSDSLHIARIDATINKVKEYFFINKKWVAYRTNGTSTCGNSYFDSKLAPHRQLTLHLDNEDLTKGKNKIKYKIQINLGNQVIESNVITVRLYDSQLKRITESTLKTK
ncbi:hypothetical protein VRU48_04075 [Pedobacter sp. KR3-3]|uniref:Outer membrane lipoprotein carrier protein LolA n=1 Tax=Pedobacter albus TaxID=3113905 RepID=A0ABU7I487_9SPHI|nr:hypothetical protein [Pedobacter sp. KR3-3]MEE1944270.1 hypothetical protein [Pedobacter sp. KR3-3]